MTPATTDAAQGTVGTVTVEDNGGGGGGVQVAPIKEEYFTQISKILKDSFGTKRFLCCIPGYDSAVELRSKYKRFPKAKWELGAVAIDTDNNDAVLGYVQMNAWGLPSTDGIHTAKRGEMYVEQLGVSADARGKGVGTKLMNWCEETGRAYDNGDGNKIDRMTLSVIKGNRAIGLYERFGYEIVEVTDSCTNCFNNMFVFVVLGRPYGWNNPEWGYYDMVKPLE